jgi:quinol monooxygenase YgiN
MADDCFAIFDTFEGEPGRDAHLNGPIAAALISKVGELLAAPPKIRHGTGARRQGRLIPIL